MVPYEDKQLQLQLMTTGRGRWAGRLWAPGELFGAREPTQGFGITIAKTT
jgi:hypothetical protein